MTQNHSKTRLRMGLSNPPKKAATKLKTCPAPGGEIQSILFAGLSPGSRPAEGHAENEDNHAGTGQRQKERMRGTGDGSGGLVLPD